MAHLKFTPHSLESELSRVGGWWTRSDIARHFGRPYSTHVVHVIESAVDKGLIYKTFGTSRHNRPAWVYCSYSFLNQQSDNR